MRISVAAFDRNSLLREMTPRLISPRVPRMSKTRQVGSGQTGRELVILVH